MVQHLNVPALKQQWVLDAQWSDCPPEVEEVVKQLWRYYELGNDNYMLRRSIEDLMQLEQEGFQAEQWFWGETEEEKIGWRLAAASLKPLIDYLRNKGIPEDETCIIHWWW